MYSSIANTCNKKIQIQVDLRMHELPQTDAPSIWGLSKLLEGTSEVLWRCSGTSPSTSTTPILVCNWGFNQDSSQPSPLQTFHCPHRYCKIQWGRPSAAMPESVSKKGRKKGLQQFLMKGLAMAVRLKSKCCYCLSYCFACRHVPP